MKKINLEQHKEEIKDLYCNKNKSLREIARRFDVCMGTIRKNMVLWEIERRPTMKREVVKPSKEELEKIYNNADLNLIEITKKLDIGVTTLFKWLKEYKIFPARRFKYKKYNFLGDLKEKAYILGLVAGDLYVQKHCRQILVELTTTHPAMTDLFYSIFGKYGTPKKYLKHNKKTRRDEWGIYVLLNNSFEFMLIKDFEINHEYFYDFLAGFFDCEGCLHIYNNHDYVGLSLLIYNSNKKLLEIIKGRLEKDGFHPKLSKFFSKGERTTNNYYRGADLWVVRLHTNKEVLSLMNLIPIKHKEKLDKLKIAVSINNKRWKDISEEVNSLKINIKNGVEEFIKPVKNEGSTILSQIKE